MGKKFDRAERPDRERRRELYQQGDHVFARFLSLWSKGTFIEYNRDGTMGVRLGGKRVNLKSYDVAPVNR